MNIRVNPDLMWGAVFSVPASVVDVHLSSASPEQLRALLWALRHAAEQPTTEKMASALHLSEPAAADAVRYWQEKGLLVTDTPVPARVSAQPEKPPKVLPEMPETKPTHADILHRLEEDSNLEGLFKFAQERFGRTLGYDGQCTIMLLYDTYGLPVDVVCILIEYCKEIGKTGNHYVAEMGRNWASEEIDTMDKAVDKVGVLRQCTGLWKQLAEFAGISATKPTAVQSEYLRVWHYDLSFSAEMIQLAYEEMANHCNKLSFAYINKVLRTWHDKGITTPQQVAENNEAFRQKKNASADTPPASYDITQLERQLWNDPIVFEKKD